MSDNKIRYKDAKGRFSTKENAVRSYEIKENNKWQKLTEITERVFYNSAFMENDGKLSAIGVFIEELDKEHKPKWTEIQREQKPTKTAIQFDGDKVIHPEYNFSAKAKLKNDLNDAKQRELYELFNKANEEVIKLQELTGDKIGRQFSLDLSVDKKTLDRRIDAALAVTSGTYLNDIATQYKVDFLESYETLLKDDLFLELSNTINSLTDYQFLQTIKNTGISSVAYSLESILDTYGYEMIEKEAKYLINAIKDGKFYS